MGQLSVKAREGTGEGGGHLQDEARDSERRGKGRNEAGGSTVRFDEEGGMSG